MPDEAKVTIECNMIQAQNILQALDLYSRMLAGQTQIIYEVLNSHFQECELYKVHKEIEHHIDEVKKFVFPQLHATAAYSIGSRDLKEEAKVAYDVYQMIRHKIDLQDDRPNAQMSVYRFPPYQHSHQKFPTVEVIKNKE